ncbi:pre-60S factor rei1 [Coemansia guatemalensis]|uniref:Pre-60S factor rei1 n=1 Tax=Coemansia guatemalensis TaxID=2761395 RepID=A0A9W8LW55_9FUNG|nr:pre-60S factor rei1 [Coemansia guatemalensis]
MDSVSTQTTGTSVPTNAHNKPLFTCIACQVAFYSAEQQRTHYRSDWHRYNLKRKVADLPPVPAESFAQRVLAQQAQAAEDSKRAEFSAECTVCKKAYGSENAFNNHLNSKKHKESESRMLRKMQAEEDLKAEQRAIAESIAESRLAGTTTQDAANATDAISGSGGAAAEPVTPTTGTLAAAMTDEQGRKVSAFPLSDDEEEEDEADDDKSLEVASEHMDVDQGDSEKDAERARRKQELDIKRQLNQASTEEEVVQLLEKKRAAAPRLNPDTDCLFCTHKSDSFESNMDHMSLAHSLFIPDLEYLVDLRGLVKYLADKISVANVCLYCNGRGRVLQSLEAVRRHMLDKGHTKIAYDTEIDILEISDFYDFSSTYPDADEHNADDDVDAEMFDGVSGRSKMLGPAQLEEEDGELVLPNGNRIGHRSLLRYYKQDIPLERPEKDSVVIHKMLTNYSDNPEYNTQMTQSSSNRAMILAQPNGYKAWKNTVTFKERRVQDNFKTRVGMRSNGLQKHYREQNPI